MLNQIVILVLSTQMFLALGATMILEPTYGWLITTLITLLCLELIFRPLRRWIAYARVKLSPEPQPEEMGFLTGQPSLDPNHGITSMCTYKNQEFKVVIQPNWWHLIYPSVISQGYDNKESAVNGAPFNAVEMGAGPKSLVTIYLGGRRIAMGSRVSYEGSDYLLTAYHIWNKIDQTSFQLAKMGVAVDVENATCFAAAPHPKLDFALIKIPNRYWSKLSVSSSPLIPLKGAGSLVKIYGGSSNELVSSFGKVERDPDNYCRLVHTASTAPGWSGAPLYNSKGFVVGVHTGALKMGVSNEAVDVATFMAALSLKETVYSEIGLTLIDYDEIDFRDYEFDDFEIIGEKPLKGKMARGEIAVSSKPIMAPVKGRPWDEYSEDYNEEDVIDWRKEALTDAISNEHLNCQRAERVTSVPPFANLKPSTGKNQSPSLQEEQISTTLDARLVGLERAVSTVLEELCRVQSLASQNSKSMDGQKEEAQRNLSPSSSKLVGFEGQRCQPEPKKQLQNWQPITQKVQQKPVSEKDPSVNRNSLGKRSRRRSNRRKLMTKLAPVPHGPSLNKEMADSSLSLVTSSLKPSDLEYLS